MNSSIVFACFSLLRRKRDIKKKVHQNDRIGIRLWVEKEWIRKNLHKEFRISILNRHRRQMVTFSSDQQINLDFRRKLNFSTKPKRAAFFPVYFDKRNETTHDRVPFQFQRFVSFACCSFSLQFRFSYHFELHCCHLIRTISVLFFSFALAASVQITSSKISSIAHISLSISVDSKTIFFSFFR